MFLYVRPLLFLTFDVIITCLAAVTTQITAVKETCLVMRSSKAKFRRRTSHEPNRVMQMRKSLCSTSLAFDSAHVKYGV